jgi:NADH:ubiquinone oxidoreductase subunit 4 (subunit M)
MLAGTGVIFAAVYLLWMIQRVFFGEVTNDKNKIACGPELARDRADRSADVPDVFMGVYPRSVFLIGRKTRLPNSKSGLCIKRARGRTCGGRYVS